MVFCGQCGSPIAPGTTRCPSCGAISESPAEATAQDIDETLHVDDPTIESRTLGSALNSAYPMYPMHTTPPTYATQQNSPYTSPEQHKLILHSNGTYDYGAQGESEATSEMRPSMYGTYPPSPYPASAPSSPYNTVAEQANYPQASFISTQVGPNYQSNPGPVSNYGNYNPTPQNYPQGQQPAQPIQSAPPVRRHRRVPVLLAVLLLLVIGIGGLIAYALHHAQLANNAGNTGSGTAQATAAPVTPSDHAKAVVQQYYNDINNKNYHDAYYLWERNGSGQSYASFVQGYAHTVSDTLTISNIVESGGTVRVDMNIVATEHNGNKTTQHTYGGYYVVGQVNGTWKILRGYLVQVR